MTPMTSMRFITTVATIALLFCSNIAVTAQSALGTVVTLTGYFLNAHTLTPVEANYIVIDAQGKKLGQTSKSNPTDGYLQTGLKPGESYVIRIEDPRYFRQEFRVDIPATGKYLEISKDFVVRTSEAGRTIAIAPSPFDLKKTTLKTGADEDLGEMAKVLIMNPGTNVELVCYPDVEGTADATQKLSSARAEAIKKFFVSKGVSAGRISVRAVSTTDPIDPPPIRKAAKGKRYIGPVYMVITKV
ncbi:MAG: OmpA family protein [Ignavibacteria bacterium]|nr:OmpA family protein [Ignavibacteria bacterium]MBP6509778.1 OmpA family protein [Candidatus Kapabacteria bacterium]MBK7033539.1 OmpA family protein [Ignavibacteria bacterium]MBK7186241.1 OmpA family protein [Ignavibacteria bacterium]MBK7411016.1 OmpA family protein [Ignavibacteria bacterium]